MSTLKVKCPFCGEVFNSNTDNASSTCIACNKNFTTDKGSKYYKNMNKIITEDKKIALGEKYAKVNSLLLEGDFYLKKEDYAQALNIYNEALKITTIDYRVHLGLVYAKTKNFTDVNDESHVIDLKNAIEYADEENKKHIKKIYSNYYNKKKLSSEDLQDYYSQEENSKYLNVERLLKNGIPKHFQMEKSIKVFKIFLPILVVLIIASLILMLAMENTFTNLTFVFISICFVFCLFAFLSNKQKIQIYNSALDLFDEYKKLQIDKKFSIKALVHFESFAISYVNGETEHSLKENYLKVIFELLKDENNENITAFIERDNYLNKILNKA